MRQFLFITLLLLSGIIGFTLSWYFHRDLSSPVEGNEDVQIIQTYHSPYSFVKQLKGDPEAGRKIFKEFCSSCHAQSPVIDVNAPSIENKKVWKGLSKLGMPTLLNLTIQGVKAMPARGGCFECSDEQLALTIHYILNAADNSNSILKK